MISQFIKRVFFGPEPEGTPLDLTPGLKIARSLEPDPNRDFNSTWQHIHEECKRRYRAAKVS